jgi:hypothetical protein
MQIAGPDEREGVAIIKILPERGLMGVRINIFRARWMIPNWNLGHKSHTGVCEECVDVCSPVVSGNLDLQLYCYECVRWWWQFPMHVLKRALPDRFLRLSPCVIVGGWMRRVIILDALNKNSNCTYYSRAEVSVQPHTQETRLVYGRREIMQKRREFAIEHRLGSLIAASNSSAELGFTTFFCICQKWGEWKLNQ